MGAGRAVDKESSLSWNWSRKGCGSDDEGECFATAKRMAESGDDSEAGADWRVVEASQQSWRRDAGEVAEKRSVRRVELCCAAKKSKAQPPPLFHQRRKFTLHSIQPAKQNSHQFGHSLTSKQSNCSYSVGATRSSCWSGVNVNEAEHDRAARP